MTISGTSDFSPPRDVIVRRALRLVGAYTSHDIPRPEQLADALTVLNGLLKEMSVHGFLWLRQFVEVTLVAGQDDYILGPLGTPVIDRPLYVFACNRKSASGYEVPMVQLTRNDYMAIPSKASTGTPVQFYYDPQTDNGKLYVWPVPATGTTDVLVLDVDRQLDIMSDSLNTYDFPPQWMETLAINLAARLAPEYGIPLSERDRLELRATQLLQSISNYDRDLGSVHFEVRR